VSDPPPGFCWPTDAPGEFTCGVCGSTRKFTATTAVCVSHAWDDLLGMMVASASKPICDDCQCVSPTAYDSETEED